jgi:hypothetical protein
VTPDSLVKISHESGMTNEKTITFNGFAMNERDCIAGKDEVACLEGRGGATWVWQAYARAPGEEVVLPGSVSNHLFSTMGSVKATFDRASIMHETSLAFGRNC